MTSCSTEKQCLKDIIVGDTLEYELEFYNPDATEKDISEKTMLFILNATNGKHSFEHRTVFPKNEQSQHGKGVIKVLPDDTKKLLADTEYTFAFKYVESTDDIETVGSGLVQVVQ